MLEDRYTTTQNKNLSWKLERVKIQSLKTWIQVGFSKTDKPNSLIDGAFHTLYLKKCFLKATFKFALTGAQSTSVHEQIT